MELGELKYEFASPSNGKPDIKVIGVGGGGSNAVNYMFQQGIKDVQFYVCNTDRQALENSPVLNKIQIGTKLTEGLGAGANPEIGREACEESEDEIREILGEGTKMLFITAGMGGGTGTGAAPVIAEISKSLGILTVGIVTRPFGFEGRPKSEKALEGIAKMKEHCDTVLVIINDKLKEVYGKVSFKQAFQQADNILCNSAKAIAEIITVEGFINVDFMDVRRVMKDAGACVLGSAAVEGDGRASRAVEQAISHPLLNDTDIFGARFILLNFVVGDMDNFAMEELETITEDLQKRAGDETEVIWGVAEDENLGDKMSVTVIATGFGKKPETPVKDERTVFDLESNKQINTVEPQQTFQEEEKPKPVARPIASKLDILNKVVKEFPPEEDEEPWLPPQHKEKKTEKIVFELEGDYEIVDEEEEERKKKNELDNKYEERVKKVQSLRPVSEMTSEEIREKQDMPAYLRKGIKLQNTPGSEERLTSRYSVNNKNEILGDNRFFHDNVD